MPNQTIKVCSLNNTSNESSNSFSRLELDTHANMPVVGRDSYVLSQTGKFAEVNAYDPQQGTRSIPIVDAALQYDCPYSGKLYILVLHNALHVATMPHHLIPPFIMREAGIIVNDIPKI